MEFFTAGILGALWLGILTSISPCPLATNIAAISFIGKEIENKRRTLLAGLFYTLGRMFAYFAVSAILVAGLLSIPEIARFLTKYLNIIIGPLLIIVGLFLLNIVKLNIGNGFSVSQKFGDNLKSKGLIGVFALGFIFALAFCPVSAGLFFGSLIPLSLNYKSELLIPLIYGIGTALPVIIFGIIIAFSVNKLGAFYKKLNQFEYYARRITAVIFIIAGAYLTWRFLF